MKINFGVQIEPQFGYNYDQIYDILKSAESNSFTHAWFSDHFMLGKDATDLISYECFSAMMAAASKTNSLRIGSLVFCNSYRHPAILAKQIASLDHFSNGRVEFGYGSGWKQIEYDAYGINFPSASIRIKQLQEGIQVIRKLWSEDKANFNGTYYKLNDAISYPKPLQNPLPIWVGTMEAKPKMLETAAKYADGINIAWSFSPSILEDKISKINDFCEENSRDPKSLKKSYGVWTRIFRDETEKIEAWKKIASERGMSIDDVENRYKSALHGTIDEIIVKLKQYLKLGINYFIFMFPKGEEIQSMEIFKSKIINNL